MYTCMRCLSDTPNDDDICDACVEQANEENCIHRLQCRENERALAHAKATMHRMDDEITQLRAVVRECIAMLEQLGYTPLSRRARAALDYRKMEVRDE